MTNKTPYHQLGSRIQELRLARGLNSQGELAALLKTVKQQSISRWEKGASRPRQGDLELLAMAIEADVNELKVEKTIEVGRYPWGLAVIPSK